MTNSIRQLLDAFQQDLKYTFRSLRKSPGYALAVMLALGLGIGANVTMFGVVDRLMFRPFPFLKDPARAHRVYLRSLDRGTPRFSGGYEYTRYVDFSKWTTSFSQLAAFANQEMPVGVGEASRDFRVAQVSASFFDFFDIKPVRGRFFTAAEDRTPRGADVIVLGYNYWQNELGGRDVLGQVLQVGSISATVIGVAPKGFTGVFDREPPIYMPITTYAGARPDNDGTTYYTRYNWGWMSVMVRRKPGVSQAQASADLSQAYRKSWDANRAQESGMAPPEIAKPEAIAGAMKVSAGPNPTLEARTALWVTAVAGIVLLIACANTANLCLARALRRERETAVRLALGVSRLRLVAQSVTETVVLSFAGAALGMILAQWGGAAIRRMLMDAEGASLPVFSDWRTLGVSTVAAMLTGLLAGLTPMLVARRSDLVKSLKSGAREGTYQRSAARVALLVTQGALSTLLLVGAGLFVRSLDNVRSMRMGYDIDHVLAVYRNLRNTPLRDDALIRLREQLVETAQSIPSVEHAAYVTSVPFWSTSGTSLYVAGIDSVRKLGNFTYETATPDYFNVMGTRILRGRGFTPADRAGAPRVVVVSEGMAKVLWPGKDALGQCIRVRADTMPCTTVVGIAEDIVQRDVTNDKRYHYYLPIEQDRPAAGSWLLVKTRADPATQMEAIRKKLQTVMPGQSYVAVRLMREAVDQAQRSWQLGATLFVAFGALALVVAAVGLYGVIAYNVAQRMHELGVRIALGAQTPDILRLVVGQGARFAVAGVLVGSSLALVASKWLQPLLFKQSAKDPMLYAFVGAVQLLVALAATTLPAMRAAKADPNKAIRAD